MKPGFYVDIVKDVLCLMGDNGAYRLDNMNFYNGTRLDHYAYRPATRQDIIEKLLPLIPEKKEPGQVAYEEDQFLKDRFLRGDWKGISGACKNHWAAIERAVLEAHAK
jgi:hypothetical protein